MQDVMLDLETLDTRPSGVILSIGAVFYDPNTQERGLEFYAEMSGADAIDQQINNGRTVSGGTLRFWMGQGQAAKQVFSHSPAEGVIRADVESVLHAFGEFMVAGSVERPDTVRVWGNGADFDNVMLAGLIHEANFPPMWQFYNNRCYRTLKAEFEHVPAVAERYGVYHNALDDAITQAIRHQEINKWRANQ